MTTPFGNYESLMRPDDQSGRYWASPPCRVRVDDGKNVSWIDLKRPYALVGSHSCCTLRIRSTHVPDVAYIVCCLRDRIEAWPTAAIAFPRWGTIWPDLPLIVGPCSLTFHPEVETPIARRPASTLANSEIETRLSWPGRDFTRSFRRPVTIIGDDHPSVLRLHGRGLATCQFAAVVQDEGFWLVNLSARRMQRSERVRRFREPGETMAMGDATLQYVASKPLSSEHQQDDDVGIGAESGADPDLHSDGELHSDIHSLHDVHDDDGQSGMSFIGSGIHSVGSDSSPSFISTPSKDKGHGDSQEERSPGGPRKSTRIESSESAASSESASDRNEGNRPPGRGESKAHRSHSIGDGKPDQSPDLENEDIEAEDVVSHVSTDIAEPECERDERERDEHKQDQGGSSTTKSDAYFRVDSGHRRTRRPNNSGSGERVSTEDEGSARAVLNLVDAALGLVDEAVKEADASERGATEQGGTSRHDSADEPSLNALNELASPSEESELDDDGAPEVPAAQVPAAQVPASEAPAAQVPAPEIRQPELRVEPDSGEQEAKQAATGDDRNGIALPRSKTSNPTEIERNEQVEASDKRTEAAPECSANSFQGADAQTPASRPDAIDLAFTEAGASDVTLTNHDPPILSARETPRNEDPIDVGLTSLETESELIELDECPEPDPTVEKPSTGDWSDEGRETVNESGDDELTDETPDAPFAATEPTQSARKQEDGPMNPIQPTVNPGNATTGPTNGDFALVPADVAERHVIETTPDTPIIPDVTQKTPASKDLTSPNQVKDSMQGRSSGGEPVQIDPELLTSHLTTRLAEIGDDRSLLQQVIRWSAITAGIIVPATVVMWVIHRIYSDWY